MRIAIFLILLLVWAGTVGCTTHYTETVLLEHPTTVGNDWVTVRFPKPLDATLDWEQEVLASVSSHYEKSTQGQFGLKMPNGAIIWPDCQIESENGQWLPLNAKGFYGDDLSFSDRALSGNAKRYIAVKLRSAMPITVSRLVWNSYDPREVKR